MLLEEIVAKLGEINADTNLPMKADGEVDTAYVDQMWPGLTSGITNFLLNEDGTRNVSNVKALSAGGFHSFAMERSSKPNVPAGRVRTDKGVILIY
tara:strand:+ start:155453 stop:155740 length:288 start_codon:yes stop_codon:yes gene_type:complete